MKKKLMIKESEQKIFKLINLKKKYNSKTKIDQIDSFDLLEIIIKLEKLLNKKIKLEKLNKFKNSSISDFIKKI